MGQIAASLQMRSIPLANEAVLKEEISRVRQLHQGFKLVSETFAISLREFEQIFAINEAVFSMWDQHANGMVDCIEFFTVLITFADGRIEDKIRFLFEFYDFNQNGYLELSDLYFMAFNAISGAVKVFQIDTELPTFPNSSGQTAYKLLQELIAANFVQDPRVGVSDLMTFALATPQIKEFFTFIELVDQRV